MTSQRPDQLKIAMVQANPTVGDLAGNIALARDRIQAAREGGADIALFSELFISGYPPEDLVLKPSFIRAAKAAAEGLASGLTADDPAVIIGCPWADGDEVYNSILVLDNGAVTAVRHKHFLPNYGVFDEKRVFAAGPLPGPVDVRGVRLGLPVCEDIWYEDVVECLAETGAEVLLVPNGSPFDRTKIEHRMNVAVARVREAGLPMVYVNQVGGQDELVFDGASFVLAADGSLKSQMPDWEEGLEIATLTLSDDGWKPETGSLNTPEEGHAAIYQAVMLGLRDYVTKNRFPGVVLGMSGGIDSALSAAIAVDALGPDKVHCVMLPSKYTSDESLDDARDCAGALGAKLDTVSIAPAVDAYDEMLAGHFKGLEPDLTEENIQSRARGLALMALSNKFGSMVLTTGNKSENSVGYATLYGDMCGGYNALKDLYKLEVFALSRWRNQHLPKGALGPAGRVIPENIIEKPPSAELRPDQRDDQSLPPYEVLDDILECLVEEEMSAAEITARGHDRATVKRIEHLLYVAEYKRRQAAPGVKVTHKVFGRDRRYPITNGFRDA